MCICALLHVLCRFKELRAALPIEALPVYLGREHMRGADVRCYVQVRADDAAASAIDSLMTWHSMWALFFCSNAGP